MSAAVMPARMFTLAFQLLTGRIVVREPATYPQVNRVGVLVSGMADRGLAFNIAVYDDRGEDMTHLFPCFA